LEVVVGGGEPVAWGEMGAVAANMAAKAAAKAAANCRQEVKDRWQEG
jgi:hypothetical protein